MPEFIHNIPVAQLAVYFTIASFGVVLVGLILVKPILRLLVGRGDPTINETISHGTGSYALFYALLVGLLTVAAYQNRERVEQHILAEAGAVGGLYSDMNAYPEPLRSDMKELLRDYVLFTIHKDWPAHRVGEVMNGGVNRVDAMRQLLASFEPGSASQQIVHAEVIRGFAEFSSVRQQRLAGVATRIPDILWYAVAVGALLNLVVLLMLRMKPLTHLLLGSVSAFFLGVILLVIVVLDDPLRGETGLRPVAFELLWERQMRWDEPLI
jgi:uncharacterized membrane protein YdcZ (DUF606 family)